MLHNFYIIHSKHQILKLIPNYTTEQEWEKVEERRKIEAWRLRSSILTLLSQEGIFGNADQSYPDSAKIIHTSNYKATQWGLAALGASRCNSWHTLSPLPQPPANMPVWASLLPEPLTTCCSRLSQLYSQPTWMEASAAFKNGTWMCLALVG